jgi:hypothetical protein
MFWTKKVFSYADGVAVDVRDVASAQRWYAEKMGFQYSSTELGEDEEDMVPGYSAEEIFLALVKVSGTERPDRDPRHPPITFTRKLAAAHEHLSSWGVDVGPVQQDSGGNHFFRFGDLEGNELGVCVEP